MNNENLKKIVSETVSKYEGYAIEKVLSELRSELNDTLNGYMVSNYVIKEDFPIKVENDYGIWEIHHDGTAYVQPKKSDQYIECNITIKPTGEISYE